MRASLEQILEALADQIRNVYATVDDVTVNVEPRYVGNLTDVTIDVYPGASPSRDAASAGFEDLGGGYFVTVRARTTSADWYAEQDLVIAMLDDENDLSLMRAIDDDPTLNGYAASLYVAEPTGFEEALANGEFVLSCRWPVLVLPAES